MRSESMRFRLGYLGNGFHKLLHRPKRKQHEAVCQTKTNRETLRIVTSDASAHATLVFLAAAHVA